MKEAEHYCLFPILDPRLLRAGMKYLSEIMQTVHAAEKAPSICMIYHL